MEYTRLGDTGLVVSRLCLGTMTFSVNEGWKSVAKVDQNTAKDFVDKAIDAGINFFDTADAYSDGRSETILGEALSGRRHDMVITTKVGFRHNDKLTQQGLSRKHILQSAEESLKRLNTDYIDLYLVHRVDPFTPMEETLAALDNLVQRGLVRYIGFSNWQAWRAAKAAGLQRENGWAKFIAAQLYYSLLGRDIENELVPFMQDAGIGTMIYSPLMGGFLSGKYTRESLKATDSDHRIAMEGGSFLPLDEDNAFTVLDELRTIASAHNASVAQVSLAWLLAKSHVDSVIVGASKMHHLEDNLGVVNVTLSAEEVQRIDDLTKPTPTYPNWFNDRTADAPIREALGRR